jgi:hypothetical protein
MNPTGYWPANEGAGNVLHDLSLHSNHGRINHVKWSAGQLDSRAAFQWIGIPNRLEGHINERPVPDEGQTFRRVNGNPVKPPLTFNPASGHQSDALADQAEIWWQLWVSLFLQAGYSDD